MKLNYTLSINDTKTKEILKNIVKEDLAEGLSRVEFECVEFTGEGKDASLLIKASINSPVDASVFKTIKKHVEKAVNKPVRFSFRFRFKNCPADIIESYWEFFTAETGDLKMWLDHTKAVFRGDGLIIETDKEMIAEKISGQKCLEEIKKRFIKYFNREIEIKVEKTEEAAREETPELVLTNLSAAGQEEKESDIIKGEEIKGKLIPVENIAEEGRYVLEGRVFTSEDYKREIKAAKNREKSFIVLFYLTDGKDTIKLFSFAKDGDPFIDEIKTMGYARVAAEVRYDEREGELTGRVKRLNRMKVDEVQDTAPEKRIELHAHTKMSAMDAVTDMKEYIKTAARWGHEAVAITDHGVVHTFPEAYLTAGENNIKLILGLEGYLIEDISKMKSKPYHIICLVKNETGRKNLYKLVSHSHLKYFYKKPRITKQEILNHREGLLLGTACYQGELFKAVLEGKDDETLKKIVEFYDYLEIQPNENNKFLFREGKLKSEEELNDINRKIRALGKKYNKPVVATGDVHFLSQDDRIYRDVLLLAQGYDDIEEEGSADLHFKTTNEMLEDFKYLGEEAAREVVIEAPRFINSMIEKDIRPVPKDPHPPAIDNSDEEISRITWENAEKIYGKEIPVPIKASIEKELKAIINNKYSVLYLIAKKMVDKSVSDGYIVGSRGSVGSSIVAFLCGISEVNPLPPHYLCPECREVEFVKSDLVGVDLKDSKCKKCGTDTIKDGYNIPFETFMGFSGEKMPDIDLNFSGEYQDTIHKFVGELFEKDKVYRAGTIVTMQELAIKKDFIGKYAEKTKRKIKNAERERLARGCSGIKRSTGQHAGGLMLVPASEEIYDFTPIQHSPKKDAITTHFDYHWIHDTLVKIDALGHDLPTSLKRICADLKINPGDIPLNDKKTMKIFSDIKELGVDPKAYEYPVGTLGVPEYGTRFTRGMLAATKPKTFSELVYIAGLSHGTDVWKGNAEELIRSKTATLKEVISVRDDIMNFLIRKGLPKDISFQITEKVRKGRGLTKEHEEIMKKNKVPRWYIDSCKKIKYMFPKAHAVAYAIMSFKIAYFKVNYPEYFYADYFTRERNAFEYEFAFMGAKEVRSRIKEIRLKRNQEKKERDHLKVLEVIMEMKERGIEFVNIDIYKSDPVVFKVNDGKVMLPLTVVPELGEKVAEAIKKERKKNKFSSLEDFSKRTRVNKNVVGFIKENGIVEGMPATDQTVLF